VWYLSSSRLIFSGGCGLQPEQTAGPSTAPLAMKLREASLRMTISISLKYLLPIYRSIQLVYSVLDERLQSR